MFPNIIAALGLFLQEAWAQTGPSITLQPASQTNWAGASATLSVAVSGTGPFTYQWQFNGTNLPKNIITTVAGGGFDNGGPATNASLHLPVAVSVDASGNFYIADYNINRVLRVGVNGITTTVAGNAVPGYSGDGGPATNASLNGPDGVVVDAVGNLYIADEGNIRVRKVDVSGVITTVAGNGIDSDYGSYSDGSAATNVSLWHPSGPMQTSLKGLAVDTSGNLFIALSGNEVIRKVDAKGIITTVAGFSGGSPAGVAVDSSGNLFIADIDYHSIVKVAANGVTTTVAGLSLAEPAGVAVDAAGNLFIADFPNSVIRKVDVKGVMSTVAGSGLQGYSGDRGAATNASLSYPSGVAVDTFGNLFIADVGNRVIRKVDANGIITTVAGGGSLASSGDGVLATSVSLYFSSGVAVDGSGNLFIADNGNSVIRKMDVNGRITTVAGTGSQGYSGDGGSATKASLSAPWGVAVDLSGNLFIADPPNHRIRKVDLYGVITTVAGSGYISGDGGAATNSSLDYPSGVVVDSSGSLFIADPISERIRKVSVNGIITTVAGNGFNFYAGDGGAATNAGLDYPFGLALDSIGNLFIADQYNNRIRKVDVNGIISTVAGNGNVTFNQYGQPEGSYSGDGGAATNAGWNYPSGVAVDASGNLFIADQNNNLVRKVDLLGVITTVVGNGSAGYSGDGGMATNAELNNPEGVAVDGPGNLYVSDSGNSRIREIVFQNLPSLTVHNVSEANVGNYNVIITSPYGSVTSAVAALTVVLSPSIISQPSNVVVAVGGVATLSGEFTGMPPLTYVWYFNGTNLVQSGMDSSLFLQR
jgi:sugar lactone lactonase YvrE